MYQIEAGLLRDWLLGHRWAVAGSGLLALVLVAWTAAYVLNRRRSRALVTALTDSTRRRLIVRRSTQRGSFQAFFEPAPEPFQGLDLEFTAFSWLSPVDLAAMLFGSRHEQIVLGGRLTRLPSAEIVWARGRIPGRALGREPSATLWMRRRLDITEGEYVTRGLNAGAVEHALLELLTRFGTAVDQVRVQADADPHLEIVLRSRRLNSEEMTGLVSCMRSLGRAALH